MSDLTDFAVPSAEPTDDFIESLNERLRSVWEQDEPAREHRRVDRRRRTVVVAATFAIVLAVTLIVVAATRPSDGSFVASVPPSSLGASGARPWRDDVFPGYPDDDNVSAKEQEADAIRLTDALVETVPGYAGARHNWGVDGKGSSLDVWVASASYSAAASIAAEMMPEIRPAFQVHLHEVVASWADLQYLSEAFSARPQSRESATWPSQYDASDVERIRDAVRGRDIVSGGYDLASNSVILYLPPSTEAVPAPLDLEGLPQIRFEAIEIIQDAIDTP